MGTEWMGFDFEAMAKSLRENLKNFGGFSPEEVRRSGLLTEEGLRLHILNALKDSPKTGHELTEALKQTNLKPSAGIIYPLLESLLDEGMVTVSVKKDRKFYSITEAGKALLASTPIPEENLGEAAENSWAPKWVDARGVVPVAGARLAKVGLEVSKYGTKEQQERAAEAINEARRQIHKILSENQP
jgi:DNA-binding PadR family transcriptional regulator